MLRAFSVVMICGLCFAQESNPPPLQGSPRRKSQPDVVVVQHLYDQVVARRPLGIPKDADRAAIWPFLSKGLIRRLELARSCEGDYYRQHAGNEGKPEFPWLELGLFSGENENAIPVAAVVERTEPLKDGSFRVYVRLTYKESFETYGRPPDPANTFHWHVAGSVISEDGRFVVDDVLLFSGNSKRVASRLSRTFTGCDGARWVGDHQPAK